MCARVYTVHARSHVRSCSHDPLQGANRHELSVACVNSCIHPSLIYNRDHTPAFSDLRVQPVLLIIMIGHVNLCKSGHARNLIKVSNSMHKEIMISQDRPEDPMRYAITFEQQAVQTAALHRRQRGSARKPLRPPLKSSCKRACTNSRSTCGGSALQHAATSTSWYVCTNSGNTATNLLCAFKDTLRGKQRKPAVG